MVGLALLTVLSLLLMWLRVRRRGRFGRKASGALRSVYPLVLGLGGWFVGLMILLVALPTVALDNELLAALSIGVPIGLGTYWGWVNRDWATKAKTRRSLGRNSRCTRRRLAGVQRNNRAPRCHHDDRRIALDISWARHARDRFAETNAKETLEARPSTG
jgi:hypothetical protein